MVSIQELKPEIKVLLSEEGLGAAIKRLKGALPENSQAYNEVILLEADLKEANLKMVRGSIGQSELDVKYNQLRERFLSLLEGLEDSDLEPPEAGKKASHGSLLYQIPGKMEKAKETRCRVRIAYDEAALLDNIELTTDTKIKDVRIAEVMEVELIDPSEVPAFSIRTFNRQEQFIEKEEYTEWIFFVKPLREGQFPLLLRVSVIEKVGEKERVRDIVLEETVIIVAEPVAEEAEASFKPTGYTVGETESTVPEPKTSIVPQPKAKKGGPLRTAAFSLVALVAFSGLAWAFSPAVRMNVEWMVAKLRDSREAYQHFADRYEGKPKAINALEKLEEIDWNEIIQAPTAASVENFLELYPEGRFSTEAVELLVTLDMRDSLKLNSRRAIEKYLIENPDSKFAPQARDKLEVKIDTNVPPVQVTEEPVAPPPAKKRTSQVDKLKKNTKAVNTEIDPSTVARDYMAFVKGGTFTMGCTPEQGTECDADESPSYSVTVGSFYIGRQEVTNAEFCNFLNEKGNQVEGGVSWLNTANSYVKIEMKGDVFSPKTGFEKHPVIAVSWYGANAFCAWMSEKYNGRFRLPTEAEWEYAARGGKESKGFKFANSNNLSEVGWYSTNSGGNAKPAGQLRPNELGVYDLSGNVWEWCSDKFGPYPDGLSDGVNRVRRGGCWRDKPEDCRVSNRSSSPPSSRLDYVGFRVARTP